MALRWSRNSQHIVNNNSLFILLKLISDDFDENDFEVHLPLDMQKDVSTAVKRVVCKALYFLLFAPYKHQRIRAGFKPQVNILCNRCTHCRAKRVATIQDIRLIRIF